MSAPTKTVLACATVIEEMLPLLPPDVGYLVLEFGLHRHPQQLHAKLQEGIDALSNHTHTIVLGYGLCSQAVIGLRANNCTLVVPRVDDCIGIFLGSQATYLSQFGSEPGTYYLTKGWIEAGDGLWSEFERLAAKRGSERAEQMIRLMLENYTRLALINTGQYEIERYRDYTRRTADRFGLRYEEIQGSTSLLKKMVHGPWDHEFVVVSPGGVMEYEHSCARKQGRG